MQSQHVTVVYKWTAKPGKLAELTSIYGEVTQAVEQNEPGAEAVHCYVSNEESALYVRDEFTDAAALGFHLETTARGHFPQLLAIATPGPFSFLGRCRRSCRRRPNRCSWVPNSARTRLVSIGSRSGVRGAA